jgi:hypothetical protein
MLGRSRTTPGLSCKQEGRTRDANRKAGLAGRKLLHLLEVERDPHAVDNNNTLADQLLVRNV